MSRVIKPILILLTFAGLAAATVLEMHWGKERNASTQFIQDTVYDSASAEHSIPVPLASAETGTGFEISFTMLPYPISNGWANVFQTADHNNGLRLEMDKDGNLSLITGLVQAGRLKGYTIMTGLRGGPVVIRIKYSPVEHRIQAEMDGQLVLDTVDKDILVNMDRPLVGRGFDDTRKFSGSISCVTMRYFSQGWGDNSSLESLLTRIKYAGLAGAALLAYLLMIGPARRLNERLDDTTGGNSLLDMAWPYGAVLFALLLLPLLWLLRIMPIYPDETAYLLINNTAWPNHFQYSSILPICTSACSIPTPLFWRPASVAYWAIYAAVTDFRVLRLIGIALAALALGATAWLAAHALATVGMKRWQTACFAVAVVCLTGVLPFAMILNRPESLLVLCIAWFAFAPFLYAGVKESTSTRSLFLALNLPALSLFFMAHEKSVLFLPLLLVSLWAQASRVAGRKTAIAMAGLVSLFWIQSVAVYTQGSKCPESPSVELKNSRQYEMPSVYYFRHPAQYTKALFANLLTIPGYLTANSFSTAYKLAWLPSVKELKLPEKCMNATATAFCATLCLAAICFIGLGMKQGVRCFIGGHGEGLVAPALASSMVGLFLIQIAKSFYEGALLVPLAVILFCVSLLPVGGTAGNRGVARILFCAAPWLAAANICLLLWNFYPPLLEGYAGPNIQIVSYSHEKSAESIHRAARAAGIERDTPHLILDDFTYLEFKNSFRSYKITYLSAVIKREPALRTEASQVVFLKKLDAGGVITACDTISLIPMLASHAKHFGMICAIGPGEMEKIYTSHTAR